MYTLLSDTKLWLKNNNPELNYLALQELRISRAKTQQRFQHMIFLMILCQRVRECTGSWLDDGSITLTWWPYNWHDMVTTVAMTMTTMKMLMTRGARETGPFCASIGWGASGVLHKGWHMACENGLSIAMKYYQVALESEACCVGSYVCIHWYVCVSVCLLGGLGRCRKVYDSRQPLRVVCQMHNDLHALKYWLH